MNKKIFIITISAIMGAIAFVIEHFITIEFPVLKITLYALPLILVSILVNFKVGLLSGFICGLLSQVIFPKYGITYTTPLWMLAPILWGLIPGLIEVIINKVKPNTNYKERIVIQIFITCIFVTIINTLVIYIDSLVYMYPSGLTYLTILLRFVNTIITGAIYMIITSLLYKPVKNIINK